MLISYKCSLQLARPLSECLARATSTAARSGDLVAIQIALFDVMQMTMSMHAIDHRHATSAPWEPAEIERGVSLWQG
jgi:hypothetical protein